MRIRTGSVSREPSVIGRPCRTSFQTCLYFSAIPYKVCTTTGECRISGQSRSQHSAKKRPQPLMFYYDIQTIGVLLLYPHETHSTSTLHAKGTPHNQLLRQSSSTLFLPNTTDDGQILAYGMSAGAGCLVHCQVLLLHAVVPPQSVTPH